MEAALTVAEEDEVVFVEADVDALDVEWSL
jgi:hypothetical protein